MKHTAALLLLLPALAVAAPVPKLTPKTFDGFGTPVETKGVTCEMPKPGELRVSVSKEAASKSGTHGEARPLVARKVEGDFELTVRVTHAPPDVAELADIERDELFLSAGLALHSPDAPAASLVFLHRHFRNKSDGQWESMLFEHWRNGKKGKGGSGGGGACREKLVDRPICLRLTRRGDQFTLATSADGAKWSSLSTLSCEVPELAGPVLIGTVAAHNTNAAYEVTFDEYTLTTPEKKK